MYGNTLGREAFGLNIDGAMASIAGFQNTYEGYARDFTDKMYELSSTIFCDDWNSRYPIKNLAWYAPEAVTFDKNTFSPMYDRLCNEVYQLYNDVYMKLVSAINKWCDTTGHPRVNAAAQITKYPGYNFNHASAQDGDGNVRINPAIFDVINKEKSSAYDVCQYEGDLLLKQLQARFTFLGASQQDMLIANTQRTLNEIEERIMAVYDATAANMKSFIEKYQQVAKQVSVNFSAQ